MRALVVEDDPDLRAVVSEVLAMRGHQVTSLGDAESAWAAWDADPFPLVLLDWILPGMEGTELCRRIRSSDVGDSAYVLMITSKNRREDLSEVLRSGASDYLAKPFDLDILEVRLAVAERHVEEIGRRREMEAALEYQALHDSLTELPNRSLLLDRLAQGILFAKRQHGSLALLLMDLDRFKEVNDTFGHLRGDILLRRVARRLEGSLRASDTVARLGGDEFAVILPSVDTEGGLTAARKLVEVLDEPFEVDEQPLEVRASVGVAMYPTHGEDAESLLRSADVAMYVAKRSHGGCALYSPRLDDNSMGRFALVAELRRAIEQAELIVHYQPSIDVVTGEVLGVEALARWPHRDRGLLMPDEFIPVAEHAGLIDSLTQWVLDAALRQCHEWREAALETPLSVNIAARSLHNPQFPDRLAALLGTWSIPASSLTLEISESAIMGDPEQAMTIAKRLADMGVGISIDDFGTGFSSVAYLRLLPVSQIKIDGSFVARIVSSENDLAIARTIIELGHGLGITVVAEGVEDQATLDLLRALRCDGVQGHLLCRPLAPADIGRWMQESVRRAPQPAPEQQS
ncbi:MAG: hypothetical protein QOF51_2833 [Chloroflexota bacterium]|jgi:diguanylate cyclase (GGDEF)-like protein|nr:hypothetical protein [Chloroflexota bacterium]